MKALVGVMICMIGYMVSIGLSWWAMIVGWGVEARNWPVIVTAATAALFVSTTMHLMAKVIAKD